MRSKPTLLHPLETPPVDARRTRVAPWAITRPEEVDAAEMVDNGRRLAVVETAVDLDAVQRMRLELGTTRAEMAIERLEDTRTEMREAMRVVDTDEDRDFHTAIGEHLVRLDGLIRVARGRAK